MTFLDGVAPEFTAGRAFNQHICARFIRERYRAASGGVLDAHMAMLDVGDALLEARRHYPRDRMFGGWFRQSGFPFSQQWGNVLRRAAQHRPAVEKELRSQVDAGRNPNLEQALKAVESRLVTNALPRFEQHLGEFATWAREIDVGSFSAAELKRLDALYEQTLDAFARIRGRV